MAKGRYRKDVVRLWGLSVENVSVVNPDWFAGGKASLVRHENSTPGVGADASD